MGARYLYLGLIIALFMSLSAGTAIAQNPAEAGRKLFEQHKSAVVTVKLVIETQFSAGGAGSQKEESRKEVSGTIIAPSGLTIISLTGTDPSNMLRRMAMGQLGDMQFESKPTDIKILLEDGTELEAEEVLRDADLDMSFIRPVEAPEEPLPYIDLSNAGSAQLLDQVVVLNRLGQVVNRTYSASLETIEAIVDRPRTFYIPGQQQTNSGLGSPAFTLDEKVLGILLLRSVDTSGGGGIMGMMSPQESISPIILPAEDVMAAAEQVKPRDADSE